jgi:AraC-like DNA-binding protein
VLDSKELDVTGTLECGEAVPCAAPDASDMNFELTVPDVDRAEPPCGGLHGWPDTKLVRTGGSQAAQFTPQGTPASTQDRWIMIDTILDLLQGQVPDQPAFQPPSMTAISRLSQVSPDAPNLCPQQNIVAALSLAVNDALLGSHQRLERFLPSDPTIEQLLQARGAANNMAREPARLYLRYLYSAILTWAADRGAIKWSIRKRPPTALPKWRFARVKEYIDLHIEEPIRLADLAKVAGLSRMHFAAQFRAYRGISPCEFVMMQRMRRAQVLLGDPLKTLAEVAFSVGFQPQAHFTTVFHRFVGNTPGCWRKTQPRETTHLA